MPDPTALPDASVPDAAPAMPGATNTAMPEPDEAAEHEDYMRHCATHPYARKHAEKMLKYAEEAMPSEPGMNADKLDEGDAAGEANTETLRMQRQQQRIRGNTTEQRIANLEAELSKGRLDAKLARYERDLTGILAEGYEFDLADHMKDVAVLTPEQFQRHCERIRKECKQDLTRLPMVYARESATDVIRPGGKAVGGEISEARLEEAAQYMREHRCQFAEALEKTKR